MILEFKYKSDPERCESYRFKSIPTGPFLPERFVIGIDTTKEIPTHTIKEIQFSKEVVAFYDTTILEHGYHKEVEFFVALKSYYNDPGHHPVHRFGQHLVRTSRNQPTCGTIPAILHFPQKTQHIQFIWTYMIDY